MAHEKVTLIPGVNEVETPALNEAGISTCNLIRFQPDAKLGGLVQKLGGWSAYFPGTSPSVIRALWGWEDTNGFTHLGVGAQTAANGQAQLSVISSGAQVVITPSSSTDNVAPVASVTAGSSTVTITDATQALTSYDSVYITTHLALVGSGIVLFGLYNVSFLSSTMYEVQAADVLGNPVLATANSTAAAVASFATTTGSSVVTVTLAGHGYSPGSTYPVLIPTTVGGVTFYGNYIVQTVPSTSTFTILGGVQATSSATGSINGGNVNYIYVYGTGTPPASEGYGVGGYGTVGYGGAIGNSFAAGTPIAADDWSLGNWGEVLIASPVTNASSLFQPLYAWDPLTGATQATVIAAPGAPTTVDGFFIAMPQRQIICWGTSTTGIQDPLLIRWCDVNNYFTWVDLFTNQAGEFRLSTGSKIIGGIQGPQQGYIWTDVGLWTMQYISQPYIYSIIEISQGCGLIGRKAMGILNGIPYWMGPSQFFQITADGVSPIACPVWDIAFQNLDKNNVQHIRCAVNSRFGEVTWYFPVIGGNGECSQYVKFNVILGVWDYGVLGRSAWIDQSVLGPPIGADPSTLQIYQHETSQDAAGQAMLPTFTTGYYTLNEADDKTFLDEVWPDFKWGLQGGSQNANIQITFNVCDFPGTTPVTYGPYTVTQATQQFNPRIRARLFSMTISSSDLGSFWRMGALRYRGQSDGRYG